MNKQKVLLNKTLVIGIIFLFIGIYITPSFGKKVDDLSVYHSPMEPIDIFEKKVSFSTTVYYFDGFAFYASGPGDIYRFRQWEGGGFFSGGTWTNDGRLLCCMHGNGTLYDIDPKTLDAYAIGDGGVSLNSLAYDPVYEKLYGASCSDLYEIDMTTGEQTHIGPFGISNCMIAIACDIDGICYGWDVLFSGDSTLYTIDLDNGWATEVFSLGENLLYAQDGSFDYTTETLYLAAYSSVGFLAYVDFDAEELVHLGNFQGGVEVTVWVHSYEVNMKPPNTYIYFEPYPLNVEKGQYKGDLIVYLNATDNTGVIDTFYRINDGEWMTYQSPLIISENKEYKFEYYSYDYVGNFEEVKVFNYPEDFNPPYAPTINGPHHGKTKIEYEYIFNTTDPDGDPIMYFVHWGNNITGWTKYSSSGKEIKLKHIWNETGNYTIKAKAKDIHGAEGKWSNPFLVVIKNNPPETPQIDGPNRGKPEIEYTYTFVTEDVDGHLFYYYIDWDDGKVEEWIGPFQSNESIIVNHTWPKRGFYTIMAKAKDICDAESDWSEFRVFIPRARTTYQRYQWFLERFPILEKLLGLFRIL